MQIDILVAPTRNEKIHPFGARGGKMEDKMTKVRVIIALISLTVMSFAFTPSFDMGIIPMRNYSDIVQTMFDMSNSDDLNISPKYIGLGVNFPLEDNIETSLKFLYIPTSVSVKYTGLAEGEYDYDGKISVSGFQMEPSLIFVTPAIKEVVRFYTGFGVGYMTHALKYDSHIETDQGIESYKAEGKIGGLYQTFVCGIRIKGNNIPLVGTFEISKMGLHNIKMSWDELDYDGTKEGEYEGDYTIPADFIKNLGISVGIGYKL